MNSVRSIKPTKSSHHTNSNQKTVSPEIALGYIDFGCGVGKSMAFASSLLPGAGLGIDKSERAVAECQAKGYDAELGDLLTFERRNLAAATFAIDVMPELSGRGEFDAACVNLVRAARNFSVVQHPYFDVDAALAPLGLCCEENFTKRIKYKPLVADYQMFARSYAVAIGLVGLAVFAFGVPVISPVFGPPAQPMPPDLVVSRTLRVVMARKDPRRFQSALKQFGIGRTLFLWTQAHDI